MPQSPNASTVFRCILCPVDFSAGSRNAFRYAAALARTCKSTLLVMYVDDPLLAIAAASRDDARATIRAGERALQRFVRSAAGADLPITLITAAGTPATEIVKTARRHHCDLVVMGYRGVGRASRLLFGSTTEGVLRAASVPVLASPPSRRRARRPRAVRQAS